MSSIGLRDQPRRMSSPQLPVCISCVPQTILDQHQQTNASSLTITRMGTEVRETGYTRTCQPGVSAMGNPERMTTTQVASSSNPIDELASEHRRPHTCTLTESPRLQNHYRH
ncbi:hypothetical protein BD410DRAFT_809770 [Rickenella mellea]|uniref:Uncharacterized protein n=1 Tax=Rickenella mellea TaxID=50990 RepID=A0A4Y7PGT3_9AGAM|nr:hypothetical protein BD410DRAFT_809790 [Rickenella mellea]TDL14386.1 hypothetical protein BD410DRAFT_809770 [Rickenella mellea]